MLSSALILCLTMLASACSSQRSAAPLPEAHVRAESLLNRAVRAQQKNEERMAEELLLQSLAASSSIEDTRLQLKAYINLARLYRLQNKSAQASQQIELARKSLLPLDELASETFHESALVARAEKQHAAALEWARKSLASSDEAARGMRRNLVARIQFESGDVNGAHASLLTALIENRSTANREEEANSLRLLGIIERIRGNSAAADSYLMQALNIDKENGESVKIGMDLAELAELALVNHDQDGAAGYLERSIRVYKNGPKKKVAADLCLKLSELYLRMGRQLEADQKREEAQSLLQETASVPQKSSERARPSSNP